MSETIKPTTEATSNPAPIGTATTESTPVTAPSAVPETNTTTSAPAPSTDAITSVDAPVTAVTEKDTPAKTESKPEAVSEGVLGYKGHGLISSLRFSKRFFWFSDDAFKTDSLDAYLRAEKAEHAHPTAAWAHETGKGLLFYAKRAEDKAAPTGIINLVDTSEVIKEFSTEFSLRVHGHKHTFQAASSAECTNWIAAINAKKAEAQGLKEGIVGGDGYKKNVERYNKLGVGAASTTKTLPGLSKSRDRKDAKDTTPRKSTEAKGKEILKKDKDASSVSSSDVEKKEKKDKSRSQSRKRSSIFGMLGNKKEEHDEKKDVKKEAKAEDKAVKKEVKAEDKAVKKEVKAEDKAVKKHDKEVVADLHKAEKKHDKEVAKEEKKADKDVVREDKKAEKEAVKEEKKIEKEEKKAEAQATHQPSDVAAAGAATATALAPGAIIASTEKKSDEKKVEDKKTTGPKLETTSAATPAKSTETTEKKPVNKRGSIFGSLFGSGKKDSVTSPTDKTEGEVAPVVPAKDSTTSPVSETAPKIEEPIQSQPIDTAAVIAPVDSSIAAKETPATTDSTKTDSTPAAVTSSKSPTTPKDLVKGFFNRKESTPKVDQKKDFKTEEPVPAAPAVTETPATTAAVAPATPATEEKKEPVTDKVKRRTSMLYKFGGSKDKKATEPTSETEATTEPETKKTEHEPKKSGLPQVLGGLFRKPSKAVKSEETKTEAPAAAATTTDSAPIPETKEVASTPAPVANTTEDPLVKVNNEEPVVPKENSVALPIENPAVPAPEVKASA